jgi:hypothetical protein
MRWVVLGAGVLLLADATALQQRGLLEMLNHESEVNSETKSAAVAEQQDSGDD